MGAIQIESLLAGVVDASGQPLGNGKVYTYEAGTTTEQTTWQDIDKAVAHANPIILDSVGRKVAFGDGNYKLVIHDEDDALVATWDDLFLSSWDGFSPFEPSLPSANTYTLTMPAGIDPYVNNYILRFISPGVNTGVPTITINGDAPITILHSNGYDLLGGELDGYVEMQYVSGYFYLTQHSPEWTDWTPTIGTQAGTLATPVGEQFKFKAYADSIKFFVHFSRTLSSGPSDYITFSLPSNFDPPGGAANTVYWYAKRTVVSTEGVGTGRLVGQTPTVRVYPNTTLATGGWTNGTSSFTFEGEYKRAPTAA